MLVSRGGNMYPITGVGEQIELRGSVVGRATAYDGSDVPVTAEDSNQIRKILTLDRPELLRGIPATRVLHRMGRILGSSKGSGSTWDLSTPVQELDEFISHNWSVGRFQKFLTLALHLHCWKILLCTWASIAVTSTLVATGTWPSVTNGTCRRANSVANVPVALFVMIAAWLFLPDLQRLVGCKGPSLFLDKACIHQTNEDLKRQGIAGLGAYIQRSNGLTIVYTDVYLLKLWTVYELATYLIGNPGARLTILPVFVPIFIMILGGVPAALKLVAVRIPGCEERILMVALRVTLGLFVPVCVHLLTASKHRIEAKVQKFDVRSAMCFDESDRALVEGSIHRMLQSLHIVHMDTTRDEALDEFNSIVRREVPIAMGQSLGAIGMTYKHLLLVSTIHFAIAMDSLAPRLHRKKVPVAIKLLEGLYTLVWAFVFMALPPGWYGVCFQKAFQAKTSLCAAGWRCLPFLGVVLIVLEERRPKIRLEPVSLVWNFGILLVSIPLFFWLYRPHGEALSSNAASRIKRVQDLLRSSFHSLGGDAQPQEQQSQPCSHIAYGYQHDDGDGANLATKPGATGPKTMLSSSCYRHEDI